MSRAATVVVRGCVHRRRPKRKRTSESDVCGQNWTSFFSFFLSFLFFCLSWFHMELRPQRALGGGCPPLNLCCRPGRKGGTTPPCRPGRVSLAGLLACLVLSCAVSPAHVCHSLSLLLLLFIARRVSHIPAHSYRSFLQRTYHSSLSLILSLYSRALTCPPPFLTPPEHFAPTRLNRPAPTSCGSAPGSSSCEFHKGAWTRRPAPPAPAPQSRSCLPSTPRRNAAGGRATTPGPSP